MIKKIRYTALLFIMIFSSTLLSGCDLFIKTNDGQVDLDWYMNLTYEDENGNDQPYNTATGGQVAAVALEDGYSEKYAIVMDDQAYVNIDTIKENIDDRFYWDQNDNLVLFTDANTVYTLDIESGLLTGDQDEQPDYQAVLTEDDKCYINMQFVQKFIDMDCEVRQEEGDCPPIVVLNYSNDEKTVMSTTKKIEMRTKGNYQNMIVTVIEKNTEVTVIETGKNWYRVKTDDGYIGFVPVKRLDGEKTTSADYARDDEEYTHILLEEKVSLAWNQIYNQTANDNLDSLLENVSGINVISPTWFSLTDKRGNLSTLADLDYVENAHERGLQVWALVNDFTSKKLTTTVLTSTETRQRLVYNIMYFVDSYSLDGINIDFEYITEDIADSYLQFLRELSVECRKQGVILSIDNYVPSEWSQYYDRAQQAKLADYIIIMNYDEHTSTSEEAGSVSSLSYAEQAIIDTIEETGDASRVINGMPFYTRIWAETPEEESDGTGTLVEDSINGNYYLSSEAVGMDTAKKTYKAAGASPVYDSETGQNFVSFTKGSTTYLIWLEDKTSVKARLELMNKYELAGAAYWSLGQESDKIWKTIASYFQ